MQCDEERGRRRHHVYTPPLLLLVMMMLFGHHARLAGIDTWCTGLFTAAPLACCEQKI